jgi:hypothetical protein
VERGWGERGVGVRFIGGEGDEDADCFDDVGWGDENDVMALRFEGLYSLHDCAVYRWRGDRDAVVEIVSHFQFFSVVRLKSRFVPSRWIHGGIQFRQFLSQHQLTR